VQREHCPHCGGLAKKRCRSCKLHLPRASFHSNHTRLDGLNNVCGECAATINTAQRLRRGQKTTPKPPKLKPVKRIAPLHERLAHVLFTPTPTKDTTE
jgi:hypothetical protein